MSEIGTPPVGAVYEDIQELYAVFVDGETKTGKGAAGGAITDALEAAGYSVHHDVAGDFFRRYVALVRRELGLGEEDALPDLEDYGLQTAAQSVYESKKALEQDDGLGDLQRESIHNSVSRLGELAVAQQAAREWLAMTVAKAREDGADVIVLDGRNLRDRMSEQNETIQSGLVTALDLYLTCDPETAAKRTLLARRITNPTGPQVTSETTEVEKRRMKDRNRTVNPFIFPPVYEAFVPDETPIADVLNRAWESHGNAELPVSIVLDNSQINKPDMLEAVASLAVAAVRFKTELVTVH